MVAPATKPVPLMVRLWLLFDPVIGFGLSDVIAGGVLGAIVGGYAAALACTDRVPLAPPVQGGHPTAP